MTDTSLHKISLKMKLVYSFIGFNAIVPHPRMRGLISEYHYMRRLQNNRLDKYQVMVGKRVAFSCMFDLYVRESKYKFKSSIPGQLPIFRGVVGVVHFNDESPKLVIRTVFLISDNELRWIISYYYRGKLPKCYGRNNSCLAVTIICDDFTKERG